MSLDTNDFDISFVRGLNLEDGAATLTDFTASIIGDALTSQLKEMTSEINEIYSDGGGRKNNHLVEKIKKN